MSGGQSPATILEALRTWTAGVLECARPIIDDRTRPFGRRTTTWRVTPPGGTAVFVKQHEQRGLYERELRALGEWCPRVAPVPAANVPRVLAHDDSLGAVMISELPGTDAETLAHDDPRLPEMHRRAGVYLRELHRTPIGVATADVAALAARLVRYAAAGRGHLRDELVDWLAAQVGDGSALLDGPLVAGHGDYSPRNWLVDAHPDGTFGLGVIDFERARPTIWIEDIQRMVHDHWRGRPDLRNAFLSAYGREWTPELERLTDLHVLLAAGAGVAWARSRDDHEFAGWGIRLSERLWARWR